MKLPGILRILGLLLACPALSLAQTAEQLFQQQTKQPAIGECFAATVDLAASPGFTVQRDGSVSELRYRMAFNNVTEGWNWHPEADRASEDYYRFKFLPLGSLTEERGSYSGEDKIGVAQTMQVVWRYDYFLAFANPYDFYQRQVEDDAGFVVQTKNQVPEEIGMLARACLIEPVTSESTTFWKATYGKPTDFTLKKRYLLATLKRIEFFDRRNGQVFAELLPAMPALGQRSH